MAYVIAEPCIGTKDTACVDACPVDCIHPKKDSDKYATEEMLYILSNASTAALASRCVRSRLSSPSTISRKSGKSTRSGTRSTSEDSFQLSALSHQENRIRSNTLGAAQIGPASLCLWREDESTPTLSLRFN
jgi:NAD-dependent dihydropyrimidine dehydrogenase PreA subunit